MNRRNFLQTTALSISAVSLFSTWGSSSISSAQKTPLYKEFDMLHHPCSLLFRINEHNGGRSLVSTPVVVKTWKFKLRSEIDVDYTTEKITDSTGVDGSFGRGSQTCVYYKNELLLNEAKNLGITHIYGFFRTPAVCDPVTGKLFVRYCVRGVRMPEWKLINDKLQVVKVNEKGETELEARKRVS